MLVRKTLGLLVYCNGMSQTRDFLQSVTVFLQKHWRNLKRLLSSVICNADVARARDSNLREGPMAVPMRREPETFEQAIATLRADIVGAFNRGDVEACTGFYTDDASVLLPDRPPIKGREAIEAVLMEYAAAGTKLVSVNPVEVGSKDDLGYYAGTYQLDTPADDGSTLKETGKCVLVLRRQPDGSWKAVIDSLIRDKATET
jgi:uncharacterized protein (TIGR02246 family)